MDEQVKRITEECTRDSDEERISFGAVVAKLMQAGVERYHADLVRDEKIYYMPDGSSHRVPAVAGATTAAQSFSAEGVEAAIRAVQAGSIGYRTFCRDVLAAGCVGYHVSLAGKRVVYYGRGAESHVEPFPAPK